MGLRVMIFCRPHQLPGGDLKTFVDVARMADEAGLHGFGFGEHVLMSKNTEQYPYGPFAHPPHEVPWLEPMTAMGAIASATKRIRLCTGVLLTPLRPPVLMAKAIATLDVLSNGRTELGIGTGWQREEYEAEGLDWDKRYRLFDDGVRACRALWGPQPVRFTSPSVSFDEVWSLPRPVQERVPLLYGVAATPRHVRRIAELGDGWCPVGVDLDGLRTGVEQLRAAFEARGRSPESLIVRAGIRVEVRPDGHVDADQTLANAGPVVEAGGTVLTVGLPTDFESLAQVETFIAEVGAAAARG